MLCDNCHKNKATIHSSVSINGNVSETHLCQNCANFSNPFIDIIESFSEIENSFFGYPFLNNSNKLKYDNKICECGRTYNDFLKLGKLGCPKCYETFEKQIGDAILKVQQDTKYLGKKYSNFNNLKNGSILSEIESLEKQLKEAIKNEEYEKCQKLKNQINDLRGVK